MEHPQAMSACLGTAILPVYSQAAPESRMSFFDCSLGLHRLATSSSQQKHEISCTWTLGCAQWALYHMWAFLLSIGFGSNKYDRHWHGWNEAKCLLISLCKQRMQMTQSHKYIQIWSNLLSHDFTDLRIPSSNLDMYRYEYVAITGARTSPWPSSLPSPSWLSLPSSWKVYDQWSKDHWPAGLRWSRSTIKSENPKELDANSSPSL